MIREILTVCLAGIPIHDTAERRVLRTCLLNDGRDQVDIRVTGVCSGRGGCGAEIDLDVLVLGDCLRPVVPDEESDSCMCQTTGTLPYQAAKVKALGVLYCASSQ